ncbi:hypothetical protein EVAR_11210_1 [Eumeta japonica]|uniref:Uncharacterized protein n=1 Tax=Eumeta variegata TaxID=151549 RepID=A0A4C1U4G0_EUMVA|nr:hypothetical protein EVAR_11210_1 [Eumeta japonica]
MEQILPSRTWTNYELNHIPLSFPVPVLSSMPITLTLDSDCSPTYDSEFVLGNISQVQISVSAAAPAPPPRTLAENRFFIVPRIILASGGVFPYRRCCYFRACGERTSAPRRVARPQHGRTRDCARGKRVRHRGPRLMARGVRALRDTFVSGEQWARRRPSSYARTLEVGVRGCRRDLEAEIGPTPRLRQLSPP